MYKFQNKKFEQNRMSVLAYLGMAVFGVFVFRLVQLQVFRHETYKAQAISGHSRKFIIEAERGEIYLKDHNEAVPLVLNQTLKMIYADPGLVKSPQEAARDISKLLNLDEESLFDQLTGDTRYVVLATKINKEVADSVDELGYVGIGVRDQKVRAYPEQDFASHIIGFVNDDGLGQYGIEQYLDDELNGTDGLLNAQTDVRGIPIATEDNVLTAPVSGSDVVLSIDRNIQAKVEQALAEGVEEVSAKSGAAIIMDPNSGRILAMANYPSYSPQDFSSVDDISIFENKVVTDAYEAGSVFKIFSMAAGLNEAVVQPADTYFDSGYETIDNFTIRNVGTPGGYTRDMTEVITLSLNTGVIHVLKQLGGGEINQTGKEKLYTYYSDKFRFGKLSGIEQAGEAAGFLSRPEDRSDVGYANMTFGQGISATMLQIATAMSAVANGGTIYKPQIIDSLIVDGERQFREPVVLSRDVITSDTSVKLRDMMETVVQTGGGYLSKLPGYRIGAKTGSAQVANPKGGYYDDKYIGSIVGMAPLDSPQFIVLVRVDEPKVSGYAGSSGAGPIFADITHWLIDYFGIPPSE